MWWSTFSYSSDEASSALDGMQPTLRQVPPSAPSPAGVCHSSTHATFMPSCAARTAPIYPAGPEPMKMTSNVCDMDQPFLNHRDAEAQRSGRHALLCVSVPLW